MSNPLEGMADELFEQILSLPPGYGGATTTGGTDPPMTVSAGMLLQMNLGGGGFPATMFPLGLSLDQGKTSFMKQDEASGSDKWFREDAEPKSISAMKTERDSAVRLPNLFPPFANSPPAIRPTGPQFQSGQGIVTVQPFMAHPITAANTPHPPSVRPRVRARRGQATDPHSIAERLRRERIAERMKQLQELVPSSNKTDRAAMLDEIVDYVKFLRLQVKVLSMSRLGGAGAVAQLVADIPSPSVEGDANNQAHQEQVWEKWSADGTDRHVAKLMEEDVGAAMQFLQSKDLCLMPISLAFAIYHPHQPVDISAACRIKPEHSNLQ